jgi:hypothetical protein
MTFLTSQAFPRANCSVDKSMSLITLSLLTAANGEGRFSSMALVMKIWTSDSGNTRSIDMVDSNVLITYASFQNLYSAIIQVLCAFFKHRPPIDRGNKKVAHHATFFPTPPAILSPSTTPTATHHHT